MKNMLVAVALLLATPAVASGSCGLAEVCGEMTSNFVGVLETDVALPGTVRLSWTISTEDESIRAYRLSRYNCADPGRCSTWVAYVNAIGTCGEQQPYAVVDRPPPGTTWTYLLEVIRADGVHGCAAETIPE